jgi:type IV pilus assembly protein PilY1
MLGRNNLTRLGYMACTMGWLGYASIISAASLQLESTPLFLAVKAESNVVLLIDDSGSMNLEVITGDIQNDGRYTNIQRDGTDGANAAPPAIGQVEHRDNNDDGQADCHFGGIDQSFYGYAYGVELPTNGDRSPDSRNCNTADDEEWRFCNHDFNPLYFNPNQTYSPWPGVDAAGNPFQPMNIHAAKDNPYDPNSRTLDLTRNNSQGNPNVVSYRHDPSRTVPDGFRYYTWTDANHNDLFDDGEETVHFIKDEPENQQNFANWFSYYRKREYVVKAVYGDVLANMSSVRIGLVTLHNNQTQSPFSANPGVTTINTPLQSIGNNRPALLDALYSFHAQPQGNTPLRDTLRKIGDYLEKVPSRTLFPQDDAYLSATSGGACQQSFVLLMTDGLENGALSNVGNSDNPQSPDGRTPFNGGPYADKSNNTLADVAMHYYQRDLRPGLSDIVPTNQFDQARHQHMVTYTITFDGFKGSKDSNPAPTTDGTTFWPDPYCSSCNDRFKIDDLRHAAFNGRGLFFQANDPATLADALHRALLNLAQRLSAAASVTLNTGAQSATSRLYQARFDSGNWSGQLLSIKIDPATGNPSQNPQDTTDAGALLDQRLKSNVSSRLILTYKPSTASGIPFRSLSDLDAAQQSTLNIDSNGTVDYKGQARLDYLRGSSADEGQGNGFRVRAHRLGDVIGSTPFVVGPPALPDEVDPNPLDATKPYVQFRDNPKNHTRMKLVLVGANDGMLHIFNANDPSDPTTGQGDANTGQEVLAYVPNSVLKNTVDLTSTAYRHRYYVDGSPTAGDVFLASKQAWRTVVVGGLGGGGQGYFALDITDPASFQESEASNIVLWEFTHPDLGFTFSQPSLVRLADGRWAAVFGNGYNSPTGHAVFFIVLLDGLKTPGADGKWTEGINYFRIDTAGIDLAAGDTGTPNGLATPAVVDTQGKFTAEYIVAGDLRGHLWRVDVTCKNRSDKPPCDWKKDSSLLFTATDASGKPQPIATRPAVGKHPENLNGFVVYFGTGKYLELTDISTTGATTQAFYGIWDKDVQGAFVQESDLVLQTFISTSTPLTVTDTNGQQRTARVTTDNPIDWKKQRGFRLDLSAPGERQVSDAVLRNGRIIFSTLIPKDQPCSFGGTSFVVALDVNGGKRLAAPFFDLNKDKLFDDQDTVTVSGQQLPLSALESSVGIVNTPALHASGTTDTFYTSGTTGSTAGEGVNPGHGAVGRQAWRKITQ